MSCPPEVTRGDVYDAKSLMTPVRAHAYGTNEKTRHHASRVMVGHSTPDRTRHALERALVLAVERRARDDEEIAMLRAALGGVPERSSSIPVPVKVRAFDLGISTDTIVRHAAKDGVLIQGRKGDRCFVPQDYRPAEFCGVLRNTA